MIRTKPTSVRHAVEREALRRRIKQMIDWFNHDRWDKCFSLIDPRLRDASRVNLSDYADGLVAFKHAYRAIKPWHVRISLHLDAQFNRQDDRPFAYVYVIWQDDANGFHMFRERWVKDANRWFTRVVGLVPTQAESTRRPN